MNVFILPIRKRAFSSSDHSTFPSSDLADAEITLQDITDNGHFNSNDQHGITATQAHIVSYITIPVNIISLMMSLCVVFAYLFARHYRPAYANRVSLRLTVLLAAVDAFYAFFQLLDIFLPNPETQTFWCTFAAWGYVHCTLLSVFLTSAVALNLHIIFLRGHRTTPAYEVLYLLVPMAAALSISLPPVIFQRFAYNINQRSCWYVEVDKASGLVWAWLTLYIWLFIAIGYCAWAVSVVGWRLAMERKRLRRRVRNGLPSQNGGGLGVAHNSSIGTVSPPSAQVISRVVARVILYPVIPIITQSLNVAVEMDSFVSQHTSFPLIAASFVATSCQGLLNSLVFLLDPTVRTGWYHVRLELIKRYYLDPYEKRQYCMEDAREPMVDHAYESHGPQSIWAKIRAFLGVLALPLKRFGNVFMRYWVYHFLLVHRDGKVYLSEYDTRPLNETLMSKLQEESSSQPEGDDSSDGGNPASIGGIAVIPITKSSVQSLMSQPQSPQRMSSTTRMKLSHDRAPCQDSFYPTEGTLKQSVYHKTQDIFFLLSGSPRPDSGIEGTVECELTDNDLFIEDRSKRLLSHTPSLPIQKCNGKTGAIKRFNSIQNIETASKENSRARLYSTPGRYRSEYLAAHVGLAPSEPHTVNYPRSRPLWARSDKDVDDLIALL
ncbi:hypothetical protein BDF22DRAFT_740023 [Syncephalis plumigaleata]|nr:hypothetical protein BDF22DRAFT_740023 [Syncephalis plumigaleata]